MPLPNLQKTPIWAYEPHPREEKPSEAAQELVLGAFRFQKQGRLNEAMECYNKALRIDDRLPDAWLNKGIILSARGEKEEALNCLDKSTMFDPPS